MNENLLIVEDEFAIANDLRLILGRAGYIVCDIAASVEEARMAINNNRIDIVLLDIHLKGTLTGIDLAKELKEENIAFVYLSANSNQKILEAAKSTDPYGFLVKPFREKDVLVTLEIARYRHHQSRESMLTREATLHSTLINICNEPTSLDEKLVKMVPVFQGYIPFDYFTEQVNADDGKLHGICSFLRIGFKEYQRMGMPELSVISGIKLTELYNLVNMEPVEKMAAIFNEEDFEFRCKQNELKKSLEKKFNLKTELTYPIHTKNKGVVTLSFFSRNQNTFTSEHLALLIGMQRSLIAMFDEVDPGLSKAGHVTVGKHPGHEVVFKSIVGESVSLLRAMDLVEQVAPLDTSVLILGESGTGKERIADVIHNLSPRKNKPFIKINCATLPSSLIESELFGHEKGSFTGATDKKIGKFELASGGTIFLDEIGELPIDQQAKLLRVLQEREIERVGGKQAVKVDVRIIAATNRNLEKEVAERRFRLDLYYRLNVFPIELPALRERKEDIKQLAEHFALTFCQKIHKPFHGLSQQMIQELEDYNWPGNVRELENVMQQSVILNDGKTELFLKRALSRKGAINETSKYKEDDPVVRSLSDIKTLSQQTEKEYICSVLKKTHGRIRGKGGAAELLDQKPTTLESRITKLGIKKEDYMG